MTLIVSLIPLAAFALLIVWLLRCTTNSSVKDVVQQDNEGQDNLTVKERDRYLATYFDMWKTLNVRRLAGVSTDLFYHETASMVQMLNRWGLRRELALRTARGSHGSCLDLSISGNIAWTSQSLTGEYRDRLIDSTTGVVLRDRHYKKCTIGMNLNKNPNREAGATQCCFGCGTPLGVNGELFVCPGCGATYTSDSYDWVISRFSVTPPPSKSMPVGVGLGFACVVLGLPVLAMLTAGMTWVAPIIYVASALCTAAAAALGVFVSRIYTPLIKVQRFDSMCNIYRLVDRIQYLLQTFCQCRSADPARLEQFMDPSAYIQWRQQDSAPDAKVIVDVELEPSFNGGYSDFCVKQGRQHLTCKLPLLLVVMDTQTRQFTNVKRTLNMRIYRNEATRYRDKLAPEMFVCSGCGMSVNMTADGRCKYCGTAYDVADYDWKIEWLDNSLYL